MSKTVIFRIEFIFLKIVLKQKLENLLTPNLDLGEKIGKAVTKANLSTFLRLLALIFWVGAVGGGGLGLWGEPWGCQSCQGNWV